jgi:hypothetical protein
VTEQSEPTQSPKAEPSPNFSPPPKESPFETPANEPAEREAPWERDRELLDPGASPGETPPIEGIPFDRGSDDDRAIRQVIKRAEAERFRSGR